MNKKILWQAAVLLWGAIPVLALAVPTVTPTPGGEEVVDPRSLKYSGAYEDSYCGFKITIPKGLEGVGNAPFGHHGIFIPFCKEKDCGGIEIYTGFNANESVSPGEDAGGIAGIEKEDKDYSDWELLSEGPSNFDGLPAYRVEYRYTVRKNGAKMKCVNLFLLTSPDDKGNPSSPPQSEQQMKKDFKDAFENKTQEDKRPSPTHEWMLTLTAEESKFAEKQKIYESVLSGLKFFKPTAEE